MILEDIPDGGVVGLPVPLGYDDVLVGDVFCIVNGLTSSWLVGH